MTRNRLKIICFLFFILFFSFTSKGQYIYNFSSDNFLEFNSAYAGQDTNHCIFLGAELRPEILKHISERPWTDPYTFQLSYAGNFKKFKSGLSASGSIFGIGFEKWYDINAAYNYKLTINENSNLRAGLNWHERILHLDASQLIFNDNGDNDFPLSVKKASLNFDLGLWYALKRLNVGFSVHNLLKKKNVQLGSSLNEKEVNAIIAYEFLIDEPLVMKPSLIFQNFGGNYSTYLLTNSFVFENIFILGLEYMLRPQSSNLDGPLYIEAGARVGRHVQIMLGYSKILNGKSYYDNNISAMIKVNLY